MKRKKANQYRKEENKALTEKFLYSNSSGYCESDCPISLEHKHKMCVIPICCRVYTDLAARAPPMNRVPDIDDGFSVLAASDINEILSRMCSSLTCK